MVGHRSVLMKVRARLGEQGPRRVSVGGAAGFEFLERSQPGFFGGQVAFDRAPAFGHPLPVHPCGGKRLVGRAAFGDERVERAPPVGERLGGLLVRRERVIGFGGQIASLDLQPLTFGGHTVAHGRGVVARLTERREGGAR